MIITEKVTINEVDFIHTYSDTNCYIRRDGILYVDAIDPIDTNREYEESLIEIDSEDIEEISE